VTSRVSLSSSGAQGTKSSNDPSRSADGTRVGFSSTASNLVSGDTNSRNDVFVHDRTTGETVRKSLTASGGQANEANSDPWLSGDGTAIAFESVAINLVPEDTDATKDVYVRGPGIDAATYGYDRLSRLTGVDGPDGARTYGYDPAGNRTSKVLSGTPTSSTYDRADRITAAGATAITVNAAGNLTAKGSDTFASDGANRLVSVTVAGTTETYAYDGDGVRVSRQVGTDPAIRSVTDVAAGLPVTLDDGTRKYVWGYAVLLRRISAVWQW
jgi:YD repeat-containing protein